MKFLILFFLTATSLQAVAIGHDQGNGGDNCKGPKFSFVCNVKAKDRERVQFQKVLKFSLENQRQIFGTNGRYDIQFCPFRPASGQWFLSIHAYNHQFKKSDLAYSAGHLVLPITQNYFQFQFLNQFKSDYSEDTVWIECVKKLVN